jgi:hypothetical protein
MKENTSEKVVAIIAKELGNTPLARVVAEYTASGWNQGYCEITNEPLIYNLIPGLWCPWCGRLHRSTYHDKLASFSEEQWDKARAFCAEKFKGTDRMYPIHPINVLREAGMLTDEDKEE